MASRKQKSRPGAGTPKRQVEIANFGERAFSENDYNTGGGKISRLLSHGEQNAVLLRELEALTGLDGRTIRAMIFNERLSGTPILSDNVAGYFLPQNEQETARFVRSMRHRASEIQRVADAIEAVEISQMEV